MLLSTTFEQSIVGAGYWAEVWQLDYNTGRKETLMWSGPMSEANAIPDLLWAGMPLPLEDDEEIPHGFDTTMPVTNGF